MRHLKGRAGTSLSGCAGVAIDVEDTIKCLIDLRVVFSREIELVFPFGGGSPTIFITDSKNERFQVFPRGTTLIKLLGNHGSDYTVNVFGYGHMPDDLIGIDG